MKAIGTIYKPATPSYRVTGLTNGNTYWFAATSISAFGTESDLYNQPCLNYSFDSMKGGAVYVKHSTKG
jgi:hypothetical protein